MNTDRESNQDGLNISVGEIENLPYGHKITKYRVLYIQLQKKDYFSIGFQFQLICIQHIPNDNVSTMDIEEIKSKLLAQPLKNVLSISGFVKTGAQFLRIDELIFDHKGNMVFTNLNVPVIAIAVRRLVFKKLHTTAGIRRAESPIKTLKGEKGANGDHGAPGRRAGNNGKDGEDGFTGGIGLTKQIPDVYVFISEIDGRFGSVNDHDLNFIFPGIQGGKGGTGGRGGAGGNGKRGRAAVDGAFNCRSGAGDGGDGGDSGRGGRGGNGGKGGDGSNFHLIGPIAITEQLKLATFRIEGGPGGKKGDPGKSNRRGERGGGGKSSTFCSGGSPGSYGRVLKNLGRGKPGASGEPGQIRIHNNINIEDLFQ